jgi:hypothetical protein
MMSCSRPLYGGYSALRDFSVRRSVLLPYSDLSCFTIFYLYRTNSLLTSFHESFRPSNSPSIPRSSVWPSCQADRLRWRPLVLYQTFKRLFVAKSLHKTYLSYFCLPFCNHNLSVYDAYMIFLNYICWAMVCLMPISMPRLGR